MPLLVTTEGKGILVHPTTLKTVNPGRAASQVGRFGEESHIRKECQVEATGSPPGKGGISWSIVRGDQSGQDGE